tara:strand:- start:7 stop:453 length:447 start_codon:yes stop_codon:yes gene_type:complete
MKIEEKFVVSAPIERVWEFITAPEDVAACIPGCEGVETIGEDQYKAAIKVGVGPIKTTFKVDVDAVEQQPPTFAKYATRGEEGGRASRISAESTLALTKLNDVDTEVAYTSDVSIVGRLGKFGLGVMKKKAKQIGEEFAKNIAEKLEV